MLLEISLYVALGTLVFVLREVLATILRNHSAHQFFGKHCPNLPIVPNPGIFGGHVNQLTFVKRAWRKLRKQHDKLGATFGFFYCDKPVVSTIDLDLIKRMVIDNPGDHIDRFKPNTPLEEFEKNSLLTSDGKEWLRLRRAIAPAFTNYKIMMPNVQSEISSVIDKLTNSLENKLDEAKLERSEKQIKLNADDIFLRYAIGLVFTCFYKQDDVIDFESATDYYTATVHNVISTPLEAAFRFCVMFPALTALVNRFLLRFHPLQIMRSRIMEYIKQQALINLQAKQQLETKLADCEVLANHLNQDNFVLNDGTKFRRSMIDYVTDQFHEGKLTQTEYLNNAFFLFLAASKTSGDSISRLIYNLAANQEEQDKLRSSIQKEGLDSEYLTWVINETLRLFPPVPGGCSRTISYDMKTKDGVLIAAGTNIHTPVHLIHRLPEYWGPDAEEFKPERWRHSANFHPAQFLAFGAGKRGCFGRNFAMRQMKMLTNELLSRYKFKCCPETNANTIMEFDTLIIFTNSDYPVNIEISRL